MADSGAAAPASFSSAGIPGGFGGFSGLGGGFPGVGGFGADPSLGGLGGFGGPGFGGPGFGGPWAPYVPVTPLGALAGVKGDLILPVVAVGVALFILLIIFLAVKAALAWKIDMLDNVAGGNRLVREIVTTPPPHDEAQMSQLASIVVTALDSESCLDKIICSIGSYGKGASWPSYFSMLASLMPPNYKHSLGLLQSCANGSVDVQKFKCGNSTDSQQEQQNSQAQSIPDASHSQGQGQDQINAKIKQANANKQQQQFSKPNASAPASDNQL